MMNRTKRKFRRKSIKVGRKSRRVWKNVCTKRKCVWKKVRRNKNVGRKTRRRLKRGGTPSVCSNCGICSDCSESDDPNSVTFNCNTCTTCENCDPTQDSSSPNITSTQLSTPTSNITDVALGHDFDRLDSTFKKTGVFPEQYKQQNKKPKFLIRYFSKD